MFKKQWSYKSRLNSKQANDIKKAISYTNWEAARNRRTK